jgi:NIPSNAP
MTYEMRIYRIKDGLMDDWLRVFREKVVGVSEDAGIPIVAAWTNPDDAAEFVWVRAFDDGSPVAEQKAALQASPGRKALGDLADRYLDSREVRLLEAAIPMAVPPRV